MWESTGLFLVTLLGFALKAAIVLVCVLVVVGFIFSLVNKNSEKPLVKIKNLNKKFNLLKNLILKNTLGKKDFKKHTKSSKKSNEKLHERPKAYVLNFKGDIKASAVEQLREEITAVLMTATEKDQVILRLESGGGVVHGYGLAASQLKRVTEKNIPLTICVDKIAASGGYMMACMGSKLLSAPFAIIGSIGVIASMPNLNRLLEKNNVDYLEITAGEFKRTITPLGKITEQGLNKFKDQIEDVHTLFKDHVSGQRPQMDLSKVATGEYWFGIRAKELNLVDELQTSDDYIADLADSHQIMEITYQEKKSFKDKLAESMQITLEKSADRLLQKSFDSRYL